MHPSEVGGGACYPVRVDYLTIHFTGKVRHQLYGKVPEDEPEDFAAIPGVPNGGQRTGSRTSPKDRTTAIWHVEIAGLFI